MKVGGGNENPNAPDKDGKTPIHEAAFRGHKDIVIFLASLTNNPNAPNNKGETPSAVAKYEGIRKILETKKQKYCWIFKMLGFLPLKKQK